MVERDRYNYINDCALHEGVGGVEVYNSDRS